MFKRLITLPNWHFTLRLGLTPSLIATMISGCQNVNESLVANYPVTATIEHTLVIEAEDFASQHLDDKRRWLVISKDTAEHNYADPDLPHFQTASGGQYIEILPDTRVNHYDSLIRGENFSEAGGEVAVLTYPTYFTHPGTYYVWSRAFSSGSEDNGMHIGLNGEWPQSSQRVQFCQGKHQWSWSSAQRTKDNHCGIPNTITLDIPTKGVHTVMVSMREDGFELDKLILTQDKAYQPKGIDKLKEKTIKPKLPVKTELLGIKEYKRILRADRDFLFSQNNNEITATFTVGKKDRGPSQFIVVAVDNQADVNYQLRLNNQVIGQFNTQTTELPQKEVYFYSNKVDLVAGDVIKIAISSGVQASQTKLMPDDLINKLWRALVITRSK